MIEAKKERYIVPVTPIEQIMNGISAHHGHTSFMVPGVTGRQPYYVINSPNDMVEVWGKLDANLAKNGLEHPLVRKVIGQTSTLGTADAESHKVHKQLTSRGMSTEYARLPEIIDDRLDQWIYTMGREGVIPEVYECIDDLTIDIFSRWLFNYELTLEQRQEITKIWEHLERYGKQNIFAAMQLDRLSPYVPFLGDEFYLAIRRLQEYSEQIVATSTSPFINRYREHPELSHQDLIDEVSQMLLAGHTSIATSLSWSLLTLGQPEFSRLSEELAQGDPHLIHDYYQEILRLYPPVYVSTRQTVEPMQVHTNGCEQRELPAHSHVFLASYFLHRNPRVWGESVREVDPSRHQQPLPKGQFIPFGVGPRRCLGERTSYMIAEHVLQRINNQYILQAQKRPTAQFRVTMRPRRGNALFYTQRRSG